MTDKNLLSPEERALAEKLEALAHTMDASPSFKASLEKQLMNSPEPKEGFGSFVVKTLVPTAGWALALIVMAFVLNSVFSSIAPKPQPAAGGTPVATLGILLAATPPAPTPAGKSYDWNGTALYLNAPLPDAPTEANVYTARPDQPATIESARALASRFGIEGQVYSLSGELPGTTNFMVTAGGPRIEVRSDNYFAYYKTYPGLIVGGKNLTDDQAAAAIDAFLKSCGFDFAYQLEHAPQIPGDYYVVPQQDGLPLQYDFLMPARLDVLLDDNGQVQTVYGSLLSADKVGTYGVRSAEEAFQEILNNVPVGIQEGSQSGGLLNEQVWTRVYPDNQSMIIYGQVSIFAAAETGQPPLITINDQALSGNTTGLEAIQEDTLVEASGQFVTASGIRTFQVDSWKNTSASSFSQTGFLRKDGDQVTLVAADGNLYPLSGVPADVPLNTQPPQEEIDVSGMLANGQVDWMLIQYFPAGNGGGGGGGGGGSGFYQLNLTGTPVPHPTFAPTPQSTGGGGGGGSTDAYAVQAGDTLSKIASDFGVSVVELMQANGLTDTNIYVGQTLVIHSASFSVGQKIEDVRGLLNITLYNKLDGTQSTQYALSVISASSLPYGSYLVLEGDSLQDLQNYNNRPVNIWGTIDRIDKGQVIIKVERYEIPFPNLQFQILKGTQKLATVDGNQVTLFTAENGTTYAQVQADGSPDVSMLGTPSDQVLLESLAIPDETLGSYPTLHVFGSGLAISPKNGQPVEFPITADKPMVTNELAPATMTIDKVELVYYIADPRYVAVDPNAGPSYIQPMWRFSGHYSDGSEFEFLVQALKDEFLLPEIQSVTPPG